MSHFYLVFWKAFSVLQSATSDMESTTACFIYYSIPLVQGGGGSFAHLDRCLGKYLLKLQVSEEASVECSFICVT